MQSISYVPATTRATMYALGRPVTVQIGEETVVPSPTEMPGEIDWRADLLRWLVRRTMFHLITLPQDERAGSIDDIEQALVHDSRLHVVEAHAVAELALQSVDALSPEQVASLGRRLAAFEAHLEKEWASLAARYELLLKADSATEFSPESSPSQISNG